MPLACAVLLLPADTFVFELLRHFRIWNAVIGLITGALLLLLRDWKYAAIALLAGLWQGWPVLAWKFPPSDPVKTVEPSRSFTVLSCNLYCECVDPERMIASLREANPDILLLMEYTPEWEGKFAETLWRDYPHRIGEPQPGAFGICLASRLPLEDATLQTPVEDNRAVRAILTVAGERITLLGVHPPPPVRPDMYDLWRASFAKWPQLLLPDKTAHTVIAGDLNSTPFAGAFARLCQESGLRDSARGHELTNTWFPLGSLAGLPLDHILISEKLHAFEYLVGPPAGSDHRWIMARLVLRPG
jgi:endonuclease/exonuclease/phosphatase (EEP) superfamily protein YafD